MSESIAYDPFNTRKSAAYATVNILAVLEDYQFRNLSEIQRDTRLPELHRGRLLEHMKHLEEMKWVEAWNDLTKEKQKDYKIKIKRPRNKYQKAKNSLKRLLSASVIKI